MRHAAVSSGNVLTTITRVENWGRKAFFPPLQLRLSALQIHHNANISVCNTAVACISLEAMKFCETFLSQHISRKVYFVSILAKLFKLQLFVYNAENSSRKPWAKWTFLKLKWRSCPLTVVVYNNAQKQLNFWR